MHCNLNNFNDYDFDVLTGRQFDKDGNNINWWDKTTEEKFKKKSQCIIDQFNNFTTKTGMKVT